MDLLRACDVYTELASYSNAARLASSALPRSCRCRRVSGRGRRDRIAIIRLPERRDCIATARVIIVPSANLGAG